MVPALTENCFRQSRHFHSIRVLRNESRFLDLQHGHAGPRHPHLAAATTSNEMLGSEKVWAASLKLLG